MIRTAIIGCGGIAHVHAQVLDALEGTSLCALCDIDPRQAEALRPDLPRYATAKELLEAEHPDVVHICTPHDTHVPLAVLCLNAGCSVLLEKPAAIDHAGMEALLSAAEHAQGQLGLCLQNRYNAATKFLHAGLTEHRWGAVQGARAFVTWNRSRAYYDRDAWHGTLEHEGGGALINQAVHTLDLLQYLLGPMDAVEATMANHHLRNIIEVEDTAEICLYQQGQARAVLYATTAYTTDSPVLVEVVCERATLRMEADTLTILWQSGEAERVPLPQTAFLGKAYWGAGHGLLTADFYACLRAHRPFPISGAELRRTTELLLACYDSARSGGDRVTVGVSTQMPKLIVLRGNSGSGKSSTARLLQRELGRGTMVISQDAVRREMLWAHDGPDTPALPLLQNLLRYGHAHSRVTILEGILDAEAYAPLFTQALQAYGTRVYAYYYDLPFSETLRRHESRPQRANFGEADMRRWWKEKDFAPALKEQTIPLTESQADTVARILRDISGD